MSDDDNAGQVRAETDTPAKPPGIWTLVANVLIDRPVGPGGGETRSGTKHFAPGAKVYVIGGFWGMGGDSVSVVGRHRNTKRYFTIVMSSRHLANWRTELVYSPTVMNQIRRGPLSGASATSGSEREPLDAIAASFAANRSTQPFVARTRKE